jgi:hypothetical protein
MQRPRGEDEAVNGTRELLRNSSALGPAIEASVPASRVLPVGYVSCSAFAGCELSSSSCLRDALAGPLAHLLCPLMRLDAVWRALRTALWASRTSPEMLLMRAPC